MAMLRACSCFRQLEVFFIEFIPSKELHIECSRAYMARGGRVRKIRHTLKAPTNPKILNKLAKCKYHPKFLAKWNGSSGRLWKSTLVSIFEVSVARTTTRVIVLLRRIRESIFMLFTETVTTNIQTTRRRILGIPG